MRVLGVEWAPLWVPLHRRAETLAAFAWITLMLLGAASSWTFIIWSILCSPTLRLPCLAYAFWMYWDRNSVGSSTRISTWVRGWRWWHYLRAYFPVKLVSTAPLPPDQSYVFVNFPHGIISMGSFCSFSTDSCDFDRVHPGLTPHMVTLNMHFVTPFIREMALAMGSLPASEKHMLRCLSQPGQALCLVAGGAEEAFHSRPGNYHILLARRKGFIRVALKSGASLVPTISFGEPEIYEQIVCEKGSFLRWTQEKYKQLTGIAPVYIKGRGAFQYTWGLLPFRRNITVVSGKPIKVQQIDNPSQQDIDELHTIFTAELLKLFEKEKNRYLDIDANIEII